MNKINKYDLKIGDVVVIANFEKNTDEWSPHYKGKVSVITRVDYPFYYLENDDTTPFAKEQLCVISTRENMKYKIGDRVRIKNIDWYNENKDEDGIVELSTHVFTPGMPQFCGRVMTISHVGIDYYTMVEDLVGYWTDEMIECKMENEFKPKFKVGDRVFNKATCKWVNIIEFDIETGLYIVRYDDGIQGRSLESELCETQSSVKDTEEREVSGVCQECVFAVNDNNPHCGLRGFRNDFNVTSCSAKNNVIPNGFELQSDGYFSWVQKKKEYPKTYEECCDKINFKAGFKEMLLSDDEYSLYISFIKLQRCRDAYWKIYGEEMGLGESWEPNWTSFEGFPAIYMYRYQITLSVAKDVHHCLVFPTEEMRDAFYENFKVEIEQCKELL